MTERVTRPKHSIIVRSYPELEQFVHGYKNGKLSLLILVGSAGTAKSQTVRRAVGRTACCWIEGNASTFGIYQALYRNQHKPVVIDDVDSLFSNPSAIRLLKCLCQTDPVKSVAWHSAASALTAEGIPRTFDTTSSVCIIANDWKTLNANVSAVEDRGHLIFFEPTREAIHLKVAEWFWDEEIYFWFADHLHLIRDLSMRHYIRASELKEAGIDWVQVILSDTVPEKALLVARLKADLSFPDERARVRAFAEAGGGRQTTWYKWAKRIAAPQDTEHLKVPLAKARRDPVLRVVGE